jgi:hypothetical protein
MVMKHCIMEREEENMRAMSRRFWFASAIAGSVALATTDASAQKLPDPMEFGTVYEELAFEAADTDGDNLVSIGEFARDAAAAFSGLDYDHDGRLTAEELQPHPGISFSRVDANNDGALTFEEVMRFKMQAFRAADTNQDDALSFDEMVNSVRSEVGKS